MIQRPRKNILACWPGWASRWLGYRAVPQPVLPQYLVCFWTFIGAFGGIGILQAVCGHVEYFIDRKVPSVIASFGASAVLIYGAIDSPLAQPRALFGGHFIAALLSVSITKIIHHIPYQASEWLAPCLCVSVAIVAMQITRTTHPPAGATALLAAVNPDVHQIGWYYLPIILLSCTLSFAVALLVDNIQRRYPLWWFSPPSHPASIASSGTPTGGKLDLVSEMTIIAEAEEDATTKPKELSAV